MAHEVMDEIAKSTAQVTPQSITPNQSMIKIDVANFVAQLGSGRINQHLVHLFVWNHRWMALLAEKNRRAAVETHDFIDSEMPHAMFNVDQFAVVESKREEMFELGGLILDLGVYKGGSTRALARIYPNEVIHGFDSFEGLPEDWAHVPKGSFGEIKGVLPDMPDNVRLYKGWFDDTLPVWFSQNKDRPISILRVDCDIYSSTKTIFNELKPLIKSGTWIVFDELIGYRGWKDHEHKAFMEFINETGFGYEYVAYGLTYTIAKIT
jgi:hypothetical protein